MLLTGCRVVHLLIPMYRKDIPEILFFSRVILLFQRLLIHFKDKNIVLQERDMAVTTLTK